jgi:secondary thiamine-phosphate synthase enzyme
MIMKIANDEFGLKTHDRNEMIDITDRVQSAVSAAKISEGDVIVFCPHTTAAITINENADPAVVEDVLMMLSQVIPHSHPRYQHSEGNSDGHCKSSLVGASEQILISGGRLRLGTWQAIYFCEFDGPRSRKVYLQVRGQ